MMCPSFNKRRSFLQRVESRVIRVIVLGVVLLVVFQMRIITDPVDFYLRFGEDIDLPAFRYHYYIDEEFKEESKSIASIGLTFVTVPENSPVKVWQLDKLLGVISKDTNNFTVEPGSVSLDATDISYPVTVEIILNQNRYRLDLDRDIKSFDVQLQSPAVS